MPETNLEREHRNAESSMTALKSIRLFLFRLVTNGGQGDTVAISIEAMNFCCLVSRVRESPRISLVNADEAVIMLRCTMLLTVSRSSTSDA